MAINFPLVDIRRNPDGSWNQNHEPSESITVPSSVPHKIRLKEVPDDGTINSRPKISGLSETLLYPPVDSTFFVDYRTGDIIFHSNQAGVNYNVDYWQCGSLVEASEINYLYQRSLVVSDSPPLNPIYGKQWYNTDDNIVYMYDIRDKWISINKIIFCFGNENKTKDQYLNYFVGRFPSKTSGLRLSRNAIITSLSAQFASLSTGTFHIRKNNSSSNLVTLDVLNDYGKHLNNINLELTEGDFLQCYFESVSDVVSPIILVEIGWRV